MKTLNTEEAFALASTLEEVADVVKTTGNAQSVVWSDKLKVSIVMPSSEKPEEFGWEILAVVK